MKIRMLTVVGFLISLVLGLVSNIFLNFPVYAAVLVGLVSEVISLQIDTMIFSFSSAEKLKEAMYEIDELSETIGAIKHKYDIPGIQNQMEKQLRRFRQLALGNYIIDAWEEACMENVLLAEKLTKGQTLYASVPIGPEPAVQINSPYFRVYILAQVEAIARGVEVKRIYIFSNRQHFEQDIVQRHLRDIASKGFLIEYLFSEDLSPADRRALALSDFVLFNKWRVSAGTMDFEKLLIFQTRYTSDEEVIESHLRKWSLLESLAETYAVANTGS